MSCYLARCALRTCKLTFPQLLTPPMLVFSSVRTIQPFKGTCLMCFLLIKDVVERKMSRGSGVGAVALFVAFPQPTLSFPSLLAEAATKRVQNLWPRRHRHRHRGDKRIVILYVRIVCLDVCL